MLHHILRPIISGNFNLYVFQNYEELTLFSCPYFNCLWNIFLCYEYQVFKLVELRRKTINIQTYHKDQSWIKDILGNFIIQRLTNLASLVRLSFSCYIYYWVYSNGMDWSYWSEKSTASDKKCFRLFNCIERSSYRCYKIINTNKDRITV